ncbi:MAG: TonB-dependent receptor [Calditrichaeota bacterium]|nr:TonB-dependent receptor [Calditrichota bacterium]
MFYRIVFFLLFCSAFLSAQQVQISVFDAWNLLPLADTRIIISADTLFTDDDGKCIISRCPKRLIAERDDYYTVQIDSVPNVNFNVYLQPVEDAPVIRVVSSAYTKPLFLPASTSYINLSQDKKAQALTLNNILKEEAGIAFKSYGGDGQAQVIALRGHAAEQTQVLFDGIPLNNPQLGLVNFSTISASQISSVAIYKGGSSLFGGSGAIGGSINVKPLILRSKTHADFSYSRTSLKNDAISFGLNLPIAGFKQNVSFEKASGENDYDTIHNGQSVKLHNRDYESQNIFWQAGYNFSNDFSGNVFIRNYKFEGGSPNPFSGPVTEKNNSPRISYDNTVARVRIDKKLQKGQVNFQVYRRNDWNRYRNPDNNINSLHFNYESGAMVRGHYALSSSVLFNSGAEFARQGINSSEAGKYDRDRYAAYALSDLLLYNSEDTSFAWHFSASTRFEKTKSANVFLPGAGLTFEFKTLSVFVSTAQNYRIPSFNEMYWPGLGNKDLKPEKSNNYEAGISHKQRIGDFSMDNSLALYQSSVTNQIKWLPNARGDFIPSNILEISSKGIEVASDIRWYDLIQLNVNYSYNDARKAKKEFFDDRTKGNRVPYSALHNISINGTIFYKNFILGAGWDFRSYRYTTFANDTFLPAVGIISLKTGYTLQWCDMVSSSFYLFVENLANENYQLYPGYPMPPRTFKLSLSLSY